MVSWCAKVRDGKCIALLVAVAVALYMGANWLLDSLFEKRFQDLALAERERRMGELMSLGHVEMSYLKALRTLQAAEEIEQQICRKVFAFRELGPHELLNELNHPRRKDEVEMIIHDNGFFSIEDWVRHWYSLAMSAAYYDALHNVTRPRENGGELRVGTIPRPPDKNLRAVGILLNNRELGGLLKEVMGIMRMLRGRAPSAGM